MARKIRISEQQYRMAIKKGILSEDNDKIKVNADPKKYNNNPEEALNGMQQKIKDAGGDLNKFEVSVDGNTLQNNQLKNTKILPKNQTNATTNTTANQTTSATPMSEGFLLTKKQLMEKRLKTLKKNSEVYTLRDFIKN